MTRPYSVDLRERVVRAVEAGLSRRAAARRFEVRISFAIKRLKIGAQVRKSMRRIKVAMASACPYQAEYHLAYLSRKRAAF